MLIDTHAHLNFNAYKGDLDEVLKKTLENDVWVINVGSQFETSKRAVEIARKYEKGVYAAVGLHPIHLASGIFKTKIDQEEINFQTKEENFDYEKYRELAQFPKVAAIGETGLDWWYRPKTKTKLEEFKNRQKEAFLRQLELARELDLPLIFHCREAHNELLEILESQNRDLKLRGVVHCFSGGWDEAAKYLEMDFCLGFNGIIFKLNLDEVIEKTPLEKILLETDCPYLTPPPQSGRNEPLYVRFVAEKIAQIRNMSFEELAKSTTENAKKLFKI